MKKLFSLFVVLCIVTASFAQASFFRAKYFNYGTRYDVGYQITWGSLTDCNILIKVDENKLTIFSKETQSYRVISQTINQNDKKEFYCMSDEGRKCNVLIFTTEAYPGYVVLAIEFSDACWYYLTRSE